MSLKKNFRYLSPFERLIFLGGLMITGTIVSMAFFYSLNELTWGYSISELSYLNLETAPSVVMAAKVLQMFSQVGLFILPAWAFGLFISSSTKYELDLAISPSPKALLSVLIITLLCIPFINLIGYYNAQWHLPELLNFVEEWMRDAQEKNDLLMEVMLEMRSSSDILVNILMIVILPAVGEELIFRGIIQKQLSNWLKNPHVAIILTAIFFSAFHLQFLGFIPRLLLGMIFGYFYYYSKNLWTAIAAHFINNGLALTLVVIYGTSEQAIETEKPELSLILFSTIAFSVATAVLFMKRDKLFT